MRKILAALALLVLLASAALTVDRLLPLDATLPAVAAAFSTYAVLGYLLAIVLLLGLVRRSERRGLVLAGVVLAIVAIGVHAYWVAPLYYGNARGEQGDLTVLTANTGIGAADADTIVRTATRAKVDVLVLEEVTPAELKALDASGLADLLPHRAGGAAGGAAGTMVFSAEPLSDQQDLRLGDGGLSVRVGGDHPFTLLAVHVRPPHVDAPRWKRDLLAVRDAARTARADGPVVAAGDFNATTDHALFREVLATGLSDVRAQANTGWQPTWPTGEVHGLVPLVAIDHVLTTGQYSAMSVDTIDVGPSDHRGLLVRLDRI